MFFGGNVYWLFYRLLLPASCGLQTLELFMDYWKERYVQNVFSCIIIPTETDYGYYHW